MWDDDPTVQLTLYFRDYGGATGKVILHLPVALADYAKQFGIQLTQLIRTLSNCAFVRFTISFSASYRGTITPTASAVHYGAFIFSTNTDERYISYIPGIKASKLTPDGMLINLVDPDVAAYVAAALNLVTPWGDTLAAINIAGMQLRPDQLMKRNMRI